jgi:hypothetical protein
VFRGLLIIENGQINIQILGICRKMLDKILAGFQFPIADIWAFYQKSSF